MKDTDRVPARSTRGVRRRLLGLAALIGALHAAPARAEWGQSWGEMKWGFLGPLVPTLDVYGSLLLIGVLGGAAWALITRRRSSGSHSGDGRRT